MGGGHTYNWYAIADDGKTTNQSSTWSFTTANVPPDIPANLQAITDNGQVDLTWDAPSDDGGSSITDYKIYRGTSSGMRTYLTSVEGSTTSYTDTGLTNGQTYYYQVSAVNSDGEGPKSSEVSTTPGTTPSAPMNITAEGGDGYVNLSWEPPAYDGRESIRYYKIYKQNRNETWVTSIGNVTYYKDTLVNNGEVYYYRVSAVNAVGEGSNSTEVNATTVVTGSEEGGKGVLANQSWLWAIMGGLIGAGLVVVILRSPWLTKERRKERTKVKERQMEKKRPVTEGGDLKRGIPDSYLESKRCPNCGVEHPTSADECRVCGAKLGKR